MTVEIYSKPNCPLCEEAKAILRRVRERVEFDLYEVDITRDPSLAEHYRYDVPVILVDGVKAWKHRIREADVERRLRGEPVA